MAQPIQVCSLRRVPEGLTTAATHFALQERSSNAGAKDEEDRLDFPIQRMWKPGRELRIRFIDGTPTLQDKIRAYANEWPRYANIKFTWVDSGDSEIRISAGDNHEFGHALGCHHEHQSPAAGIPWNEAAVLEYYKRTNGWDEAMFRHSLLVKYPASETKFSAFDEDPPLTSQELTKRANFAKEFPVPPIVTVGLNYIDADREHNVGVQAAGDQVATSSAEVALSHWSDTEAYGMGCTRGTFAVDDPDIQVGEFATSEDHPWSEPKQKTSQRVIFKRPFSTGPPRS
ncbi:hypothetical protein EDB81DRAFT_899876 [Dactylonectria macrodidyma]|uniref:H-type lectin domain-containing protein n=1 Tax=Dactylonectria macrodidyma TaxID=307937 RepID=A0A9P9ERB9_9HYPO|nr:hypothetical protein EDB81DRAFT_899876 [Dactylonectria macrodidyma]